MIPQDTEVAEIQSNLAGTGEHGTFSVDTDSLGKIMSVLTNLYSDPEMAVAREYGTNALDSQLEAQATIPGYVWRPVEVTTPSHFTKTYTIRDFGLGMTVDDIRETYSKYGKSTKEASNNVTGMLGLGSKSALTYTNSFTIIGYKNGVKTTALISKNEEGVPEFQIVDTVATTEPNGVEISIPVRDRNSFEEKTQKLLRWWPDNSVLVNGRVPAKHGYTKVKDTAVSYRVAGKPVVGTAEVYLIDNKNGYSYDTPTSYVVMGHVPYAVDHEHVPDVLTNARLGFVAFVPMGAVAFPPNREHLMYTATTKDVLTQVGKDMYKHVLAQHVKTVHQASGFVEAWKAFHKIPAPFNRDQDVTLLTFRGYDFKTRLMHDHMSLSWYRDRGEIAERQQVDIGSHIENTIVVIGVVQGTKPTSYFKKKVKHYAETNNLSVEHGLLVDADIDSPWLAHLPRVTANTIKAIKLPRNPSNAATGPRVDTPYDYYWVDSAGTVQQDSQTTVVVQPNTVLTYITPADLRETYRKSGTTERELIAKVGSGTTMVVLGQNRFDKFLRTHPKAVKLSVYVKTLITGLVSGATPADNALSDLNSYMVDFLKASARTDFNDPDMQALWDVVKSGGTGSYERAIQLAAYLRKANITTDVPNRKKASFNPLTRYPLLRHCGYRDNKNDREHMCKYMNAIYAETQVKP